MLFALTGCESSDAGDASPCASVQCADNEACDETTGECVTTEDPECVSDSDCGDSTLSCREGQCVAKCDGVVCDDGQLCDETSGGCIDDFSCSDDDDCPEEMTCGSDGQCGLDRLGDCTGGIPCAEGLTCVNGPVSLCVGECDVLSDCNPFEFCASSTNLENVAPLFSYIGYCFPNLCEPGGDDFGIAQDADFLGPCSDREGNDDAGICIPGTVSGAPVDICVANNGTKTVGEACDPTGTWGDEDLCTAGSFCLEPVFGGTCAEICNVFDESECADTEYFGGMNSNACAPFSVGEGFCVPAIGAGAEDASCDPANATGVALCQDNYGCGPSNLEHTEYSCGPWCDPATSGVSATFCGEEEYCWPDPSTPIGVCAPTACTSAVQCNDDEVCDPTTGDCIDILSTGGCITAADCSEGQLCEANVCVVPRLGDCSGDTACAAGLTCISGGGGAVNLCVGDCESNTDCGALEYCATSDNVSMNPVINNFFGGFIDNCLPNLCSPTVTSSDQNIAFNAEFMGPCSDRHGNDEAGICLGPQNIAGNVQGICMAANGPLAEGDACNPQAQWGDSDLCGSGTFCPPTGDNLTCLAGCDVLGTASCAEVQACAPLFDHYGVCVDATGAPGAGETCNPAPSTTTFPCANGYGCAPLDADFSTYACQAFCDPTQDGSTATFCSESETCTVYDEENPGIGICLPEG
jgi:hypothetical protein